MSDSPLFIIGLPRSGSTLWANVVARHPDVASFNEMYYLHPWRMDFRGLLRKAGNLKDSGNVRRLVDRLLADPPEGGLYHGRYFWRSMHKMEKTGLREALTERICALETTDIGSIFRVVIEEAVRARGKKRAAIKFPVHPNYMVRLMRWWPEAYLVHISRDPRALAASKTNDPGGTALLTTRYPSLAPMLPYAGMTLATMQYIWTSRIHAHMEKYENYRLFFYEDLVSDPERTIKRLCEYCDLVVNEAMLDPAAGQASSVTGATAGGFDPSRVRGWQRVLAPWQSRLIVHATRKSMKRFGYIPQH